MGNPGRGRVEQFRHELLRASTSERIAQLADDLWRDALHGDGLDRQFAIKTLLERVMGPPKDIDDRPALDGNSLREAVTILIAAGVPPARLPPLERLPERPSTPTHDDRADQPDP